MALLPVLSMHHGESFTSYFDRAARFHGNMDLRRFLSFIEFAQTKLNQPDMVAVSSAADVFGLTTNTILNGTFLRVGSRMRSLRGETFHAEFANLDQTSFCPQCLLEDGGVTERWGRVDWRIEPLRSCAKHNVILFRRKNRCHSEKLQLMNEVAPSDLELRELADSATRSSASDLETYIRGRLDGRHGPEWLDTQPIDIASKATEMLGIILTQGAHCTLPQMTALDWHMAGHEGFQFTSRGEAGIRDAFETLLRKFKNSGQRGGPQKVFGRLYQWLQFNKNSKPKGHISEVLREFVLNSFPIEAGTKLFGEVVETQRVQTISSLSRKTGEHYKTVTVDCH